MICDIKCYYIFVKIIHEVKLDIETKLIKI
jgi:hypothetical protein